METTYLVGWFLLMVAMIVLEASTVTLVSIWFAGGALAALIAALCGASVTLQIVLFVAVSGILLACLRPLMKQLRKTKRVPTNADRILNQIAVVTEPIDNLRGTGAVKIDGKFWTARSAGEAGFQPGETVRILRIEGVKVIVTAAEE